MRYNRRFIVISMICCICITSGCESLQKKFTRKKKKTESTEQMVIVPRDYDANPLPPEVRYKQYFTYWKSWNQELITALNDQASYKKIVDCVEQARLNLIKMTTLLEEAKSKELQVYLQKTERLKLDIENARNMPQAQMNSLRYTAERILSTVNRQFDLSKMRSYLKPNMKKNENI